MSDAASANKLLLIILAIFLPPLAVFLKEGAGTQFIINLILWILSVTWIVATIHAIWVVVK
jgi:uncharacterized membrane protein YqaE (UPF0057 family)